MRTNSLIKLKYWLYLNFKAFPSIIYIEAYISFQSFRLYILLFIHE